MLVQIHWEIHNDVKEGIIREQLKDGHVVTCEPGCYFMPLLMGQALADKDKVSNV